MKVCSHGYLAMAMMPRGTYYKSTSPQDHFQTRDTAPLTTVGKNIMVDDFLCFDTKSIVWLCSETKSIVWLCSDIKSIV